MTEAQKQVLENYVSEEDKGLTVFQFLRTVVSRIESDLAHVDDITAYLVEVVE